MAVSYLSQNVLKADPYVIPMNLDLMAKVLSVKQEKFDTAGRNIQTGINSLASSDILKDQDRAYLNEKINGLVNSVNQIGGQDLSDINISNSLSNMGSDITGDEKVINAISSTRAIRSLQESYKQYKTDPKLNKLYSSSNEWYDNQAVNEYMSNGEIGASYHGSSTPTPYKDYKEKLFNNLKNVKANYEDRMTDNGLFYSKTSTERVSPERIVQAAADLLTADEKAQLERDGLFGYKDLTKDQLVQKAYEVTQFKLSGAYATLQSYSDGLVQAANDPNAKKQYEALIAEQTKEIEAIKGTMNVDIYSKAYDSNPKGFQTQVYKDEFNRGLASTFAYTKNKQDVVENRAAMFKLKMAQAERFHNDEMQMKQYELSARASKEAGDPASAFTYTENNTDPNDPYRVSQDTFDKRSDELSNQNTVLTKDFFNNFLLANPELADKVSSGMSGSGMDYKIKGQSFIENNNGVAGLQFDDFKNLTPGTKEYVAAVNQAKLTPSEVNTFYNLYDNYQKAATGKIQTDTKLPEGFTKLVEQVQLNNEAIKANSSKVASVNQTLANEFNISPEEINLLEKVKNLDGSNQGVTSALAQGLSLSTKMPQFLLESVLDKFRESPAAAYLKSKPELFQKYINASRKVQGTDYTSRRANLYSAIENKPFFPQMTLQGGYLGKKKEQDAKALVSTLLNQTGEVTNGQTTLQGSAIPTSDIELLGVGRQNNGTYSVSANVKIGSGDKAEVRRIKVALQPSQVAEFGFFSNPYQPLDESVGLTGRSNPLFITAELNRQIPDRKLPLKASVVIRRLTNSREDLSSVAELVDENGKKLTEIKQTRAKSPSEAYALAKAFVQMSEQSGFDYQKMLELATNSSY